MSGIKTAISVEKDLFERVDLLAKEIHVSRSRLFSMAVSDYLKKYENKKLLAKIDAAYDDALTDEESKFSGMMKAKHKKTLRNEQW